MRNWLTFDGVSTKDFGVYISGGGTYNAPARSREVISVPGRNGDLIIDNGRYENTEVVYHAFIYRDFAANIEGLRNLLLSRTGYVRIEDTYHPDEFRIGVYSGDFQADVVDWLEAGEFDLTFNCKPQRFLKNGYDLTFGADAFKLTASGVFYNPTPHEAKPIIRLNMNPGTTAAHTFTINGSTLTLQGVATSYIDFDCDLMDAYQGNTHWNQHVSGDFPTLAPGDNTVTFVELVDSIEIIPRWWVL